MFHHLSGFPYNCSVISNPHYSRAGGRSLYNDFAMIDLFSLSLQDMEKVVAELGQPRYRAVQVWDGLYRGLVADLREITTLPSDFREQLAGLAAPLTNKVAASAISVSGDTRKLVLELEDGETVELVVMVYADRVSACISTQVGCGLGCAFCATGISGLVRNLHCGEIVRQAVEAARVARDMGRRLNNLVFMGMGEPLQNWSNLWKAIFILNHPRGLSIGARHITVSTVGIPYRIREMADVPLQVGLAVSLHAPNDRLRRQIMPVATKYSIQEILDACRHYVQLTKRRVTFEYVLLRSFNDAPAHARELAGLLKGLLCHVNLIPVNPVEGAPFSPPPQEVTEEFREILAAHGIPCTVRAPMGLDIDAACGQLRARRKHASATV